MISQNAQLRVVILVFSFFLMLFTPIFISYELLRYLSDDTVHQNHHTYRADSIDYPNITICNPTFFKNKYLRGMYGTTVVVVPGVIPDQ